MIELPNDFKWVDQSDEKFESALNSILQTNDNLNIIGSAGSGKSLLIKIASKLLQNSGKSVVVCSTTGISSVNLNADGIEATTLHSFFRLAPLPYFPEGKIFPTKLVAEKINKMDVLIIDEVSMLSSHLFDVICKLIEISIGKENSFPRIILFSDIFQLPPVVNFNDAIVKEAFNNDYNGKIMFFNSNWFDKLGFRTIQLNRLYRQSDATFQKVLNRMRMEEHTYSDINYVNQYVMSEKEYSKKQKSYIYLATTNKMVDEINREYINNFSGKSYIYDYKVTGTYDLKNITQDRLHIELKEGMQIMCTRNNYENNYRNGTIGIVEKCYNDNIDFISNKGVESNVVISDIDQYDYFLNDNKKLSCKSVGKFTQLDCRVCKSLTTHHSQGQTLDAVYFNPGKWVFAEGLTYVALSRLTSVEGLGLARPLRMNDIRANKESLEFINKL